MLPAYLLGVPRLRAAGLLARARVALTGGRVADALVDAESATRSHPTWIEPAVLRAQGAELAPAVRIAAWRAAWAAHPWAAQLQDQLLKAWIADGCLAQARALVRAIFVQRVRQGSHRLILELLPALGWSDIGACWRRGNDIEVVLFQAETARVGSGEATLILKTGRERRVFQLPADGRLLHLRAAVTDILDPTAVAVHFSGETDLRQLCGSPVMSRSAPSAEDAVAEGVPPLFAILPLDDQCAGARECVTALLQALPRNERPVRLVVVADCLSDSPIKYWLSQRADEGVLMLLHNRFRIGYARSCNRAMAALPPGDVVLLQPGACVAPGGIDRLSRASDGAPDTSPAVAVCRKHPRKLDVGCGLYIPKACLARTGLLNTDEFHTVAALGEWVARARAAGKAERVVADAIAVDPERIAMSLDDAVRALMEEGRLRGTVPGIAWAGLQARRLMERASPFGAAMPDQHGGPSVRSAPAVLAQRRQPRVAIWGLHACAPAAAQVLALARLLAGRTDGIRLLVFGDVHGPLWRTGVVDHMSTGPAALDGLPDVDILRLAGCRALLTTGADVPPPWPWVEWMDQDFDPAAWLDANAGRL